MSNRVFLYVMIFLCLVLKNPQKTLAANREPDDAYIESRAEVLYEKLDLSVEEIYDQAVKRAMEFYEDREVVKDPIKGTVTLIYRIYYAIKSSALYISAIVIFLGAGYGWLYRYNTKKLKRVLTVTIGIPTLLLVVLFGVGILIG